MPEPFPTLKRGSRDPMVSDLQEALNDLNPAALIVDGHFGMETERQVLIFQGKSNLSVDGIVGRQTWLALGYAKEEVVPVEEDEFFGEDWRGEMRCLLMRYQMLMWAGAPLFLAVQIWGQMKNHPVTTETWIVPAIIAAFFIPIWIMFGKLFLAFRTVFKGEEEQEARARLARIAERELAIRRAERLRNARSRLARIHDQRQAAESRRLALDVDKIRRQLDTDPGNDE